MDSTQTHGQWQLPEPRLATLLPDFLIVSPPKTGSTWLAANLNLHPEVFIPDIKEVHFFSCLLHLKTWDWYTDYFRAGQGLTKGEASPDYCLMPPDRVRLMHAAMPKLKLIYLMREPISQAWSHARHCLRHRLTTFEGYQARPQDVPDDKWIENFTSPSSLRSLQIQEHLQRWLACFPREQVYVDYYSAISDEPEQLMRRIFKFLGVGAIADFAEYPLRQKLNEGTSFSLPPHLREFLRRQLGPSVPELAEFLRREFELTLPAAWKPLLQPAVAIPAPAPSGPGSSAPAPAPQPATPRRGLSFTFYERHRLRLKYAPRTRIRDYFGFHIVIYKDMFVAIDRELGGIELKRLRERHLARLEARRLLFRAASLAGVKLKVAVSELAQARRLQASGFSARVIGWLRHDGNRGETQAAKPPCSVAPCATRCIRGRRAPRTRDLDFHGYQIVYHRGIYHGIAHAVGHFDPRKATQPEMARLEKEGQLYRSPALEYVQLQIAEKKLAPCYRGPRRRSIVIRAPRFFLRRLSAFASDMNGKLRAKSR